MYVVPDGVSTTEQCPGPTHCVFVVRIGAVAFVYGPSGELARATPTAYVSLKKALPL
jgi:hypothetical protein